ncbi:hypothetical protein, partial [Butyrivibrio fibrisolvens]|uniref:hypothetical protein n=1 Tax=Butyrivibrio fibrisolvens TaxID=831 RepID=UPI000556666B
GRQYIYHCHAFNSFIKFMSVIDGDFHSARGPRGYREASLDPRMESSSYHALNYKTINSLAMIYILPAPVKTLGMPARPSGNNDN